jgi:hypothetical protein
MPSARREAIDHRQHSASQIDDAFYAGLGVRNSRDLRHAHDLLHAVDRHGVIAAVYAQHDDLRVGKGLR